MRKPDDGFMVVIIFTVTSLFLVIFFGALSFWASKSSCSEYNNGFCKKCSIGKYYIINDYIRGGNEYLNFKCDNCGNIVENILKGNLTEMNK